MQRFSSFEDDEFDENEKSLQQILIKFKSFNGKFFSILSPIFALFLS